MATGGGVEVDVSELERELKAIERRVTDYSPITPVLAEILLGYVNDRWDSGGNGDWPALALSTLRKRRKRGRGAQILKDSGRAISSPRTESDHESFSVVTDVGYMIYHVSQGARSVIPLRDPFDVEEAAWPELSEIIGDFVAGES